MSPKQNKFHQNQNLNPETGSNSSGLFFSEYDTFQPKNLSKLFFLVIFAICSTFLHVSCLLWLFVHIIDPVGLRLGASNLPCSVYLC